MSRTTLAVAALVVVAVAGSISWLTMRVDRNAGDLASVGGRTPRSISASTVDPGIAEHKPHLAPAPPEPTFSSREQTVHYYDALVEGERRALAVVEGALGRSRAGGEGWEHHARLEAMRTDYQQRIQRHQARLDVK